MAEVFTIIDFETTGLDYKEDQIIEVGAIKCDFRNVNKHKDTLQFYVRLEKKKYLPSFIVELTGITKKELDTHGLSLNEAYKTIANFIEGTSIVAHNASFDLGFINHIPINDFFCTRTMSCIVYPNDSHRLEDLAKTLKFPPKESHRALNDAFYTTLLFNNILNKIGWEGIDLFRNKLIEMPDRPLRYIPPNTKIIK